MQTRRVLFAGFMVAVLSVLGCGRTVDPVAESPPQPQWLDLDQFEIVDLSHSYDQETLYWPSSPSKFELERLHHGPTEGGFFYSAAVIRTPEHGGTHLDAPIHFGEGRWSTEEIPLQKLVGPAVVIDVTPQCEADPDYRMTVADVESWEAKHGRVPAGSIVLMATGWSDRWPRAADYLGDDAPGKTDNLHFPAFSAEAARVLVEERGAAVLGLDTASLDYGPSTDFPVHQITAAANVPGLENLTNLNRLPPLGAWVIALPMKIGGGSGGPLRAIALLPPS